MIAARDIAIRRGGRMIVDGIDLALDGGEVVAILGPNGAGKTTLLRALSGEIRPDRGTVTLDGRPLSLWPARALARRRAVMAQQHHLAFDLAAEEVIELGRLPWRDAATFAQSRAACLWATHIAGADTLLGCAYATLSGGEQARVQFARALAQLRSAECGARLLLLDEPTANLDLAFRVQLLGAVRGLAAAGFAIAIIVHDLNEALAVADRCLLLDRGRIAASGAAAKVLDPDLLAQVYGTSFARVGGLVVPDYASARAAAAITCPSSP